MAPAYRIGKGPIVVALEEFLAEGDVATWHKQLTDEIAYLETTNATEFDTYLASSGHDPDGHLARDVFGPGKDADSLSVAERRAAEEKGLSRRLVYGRGMRRALEIAYGFGDAVARVGDPWTIDVYWGCGQPFNLVSLRTNTARKSVTMIVYSDEIATGDERDTVQPRDATKNIVPDAGGDLFLVDDREGIGEVKEWRATTRIGFTSSPEPA
jgi:hypothetical protein